MAVTLPEAWELCERMDREYDARLRRRQIEAQERVDAKLKEAENRG